MMMIGLDLKFDVQYVMVVGVLNMHETAFFELGTRIRE
jgi:hypothetical protein